MKRLAALVLALMCMCSFANAEELKNWLTTDVAEPISEMFANETLITTAGAVSVETENDIAVLSFCINAEGETVAEANEQAMNSIAVIKDVLIAQGVEEKSIWHKRYDVSPKVAYHNSKLTDNKVIEGYLVEIILCVRLTDISLVDSVIDAAMQSGACTTHDLSFESSTASAAYEAALVQASQQAMNRAQKLAEGCGMTLGDLVSVTELSALTDGEAKVEVTYRAK